MKNDEYYLAHMLEFSIKIVNLSQDIALEEFIQNELLQVTCLHWLQIVGEAANHVSKEFQQTHPEIHWRAIISMRNKIVHDYIGIDNEIVWRTITDRIPELILFLQNL